ncbi:PREDICTED: troponin T, skeletal muscle-like [Camelina sativa]|uniref:Troponin T, skeletal muscle-like n=1 Tax=Camelina sativa TaxID=90675 RepID=A0ABM0ZB88_CAMSA|nr:PREDICTED: troponin T, skeletal muscle-like [Camelina sativa]
MKVSVEIITGTFIDTDVSEDATVKELKEKVSAEVKLPVTRLILVIGDEGERRMVMEDEDETRLRDLEMGEWSHMYLFFKHPDLVSEEEKRSNGGGEDDDPMEEVSSDAESRRRNEEENINGEEEDDKEMKSEEEEEGRDEKVEDEKEEEKEENGDKAKDDNGVKEEAIEGEGDNKERKDRVS